MGRVRNLVRSVLRQAAAIPRTSPGTVAPSDAAHSGQGSGSVEYSPGLDGAPDPGEVVWAWVPYEDDPTRGKDRPVLLIGRRGSALVGLQLSSKDHDRDAADEARYGRYWMDIGAGDWDSQRRSSEVRLDRSIVVDAADVRREGAVLDRTLFEAVIREARGHQSF